MPVVIPRKQRLPLEHLGKDTPGRPDIHALVILTRREHNLRSAIPSGDDVLGQVPGLVCDATRKAEVGDFEVAVGVDQDVGGLREGEKGGTEGREGG